MRMPSPAEPPVRLPAEWSAAVDGLPPPGKPSGR
jgi:hypothetical protein